jgi:hypothetical protein
MNLTTKNAKSAEIGIQIFVPFAVHIWQFFAAPAVKLSGPVISFVPICGIRVKTSLISLMAYRSCGFVVFAGHFLPLSPQNHAQRLDISSIYLDT